VVLAQFQIPLLRLVWILAIGLFLNAERALPAPAPASRLSFQYAPPATGKAVLTNRDEFIRALSPFDRAARMKTEHSVSEGEFLGFLNQNVVEWSPAETNRLDRILHDIQQRVSGWSLPLPGPILLVKTTGHEEGNACYTRENAIILPEQEISHGQNLEGTLLHELFHVVSRANPELRKRLYQIVGFSRINEVDYPQSIRDRKITNPDGVQTGWRIIVTNQSRVVSAVPILFASTPRYDPKKGGEFFDYLTFKLLAVEEADGRWGPSLQNGRPELLDAKTVSGFFEQVGRNTDYIIHPDEILAVNFEQLALDHTNLPTPRILREMKDVLTTNGRE
jgi:hypothetical protein